MGQNEDCSATWTSTWTLFDYPCSAQLNVICGNVESTPETLEALTIASETEYVEVKNDIEKLHEFLRGLMFMACFCCIVPIVSIVGIAICCGCCCSFCPCYNCCNPDQKSKKDRE